MSDKLAWGILSTGRISGTFAEGVQKSARGKLVAVGSRSQESAHAFGEKWGIPNRHGSYEALLADPAVQAVYISTPHPLHAEWAVKAAEAGKHILCEKPMTLNYWEALGVIEAAEVNGVFFMEAFMYRCSPQTKKLVELIKSGAIGRVRTIVASFGFNAGFNPNSRLYANELGGGGIMDVGCYPTSMARLLAGAALDKDFADPIDFKAVGHLGQTGVDEWTAAVARFEGDIVAQLSTGVAVNLENAVRVYGSDGNLHVPNPWMPGRDGSATKIVVQRKGAKAPEEIVIEYERPLYAIEADTVAEHVAKKQAPSPAMNWADSLGNMQALDRWRAEVGVAYKAESAEHVQVLRGGPLRAREGAPIPRGRLPGLDKPVARLVMGVDNQRSIPHCAAMFDDYFEKGGNTFDTGYIYGGGNSEKLLGQWVKRRGVREQVVILDKGGHTPHCNPAATRKQLAESLERLQMDRIDIYMLHRDNPEIPAGEFVDMMAEFVAAGKVTVWGVSNWSLERVKEAQAYARAKGAPGIAALSNNFSLARMVNPVWGGCVAASTPGFRAWLAESQMAVMPWSSQARGFFVRGAPYFQGDPELVRSWYAPDNFERLARVEKFAKERKVLPINVALAYVLCQPFPTFPLVGPRVPSELRTSLPGLDLKLTPAELKWLNLEE
ncbi:MAG: aldo/keto reductase [Planctomycetota bacterium]|nr:aldo/keto reductase [Planctomycetota bacterium]